VRERLKILKKKGFDGGEEYIENLLECFKIIDFHGDVFTWIKRI